MSASSGEYLAARHCPLRETSLGHFLITSLERVTPSKKVHLDDVKEKLCE